MVGKRAQAAMEFLMTYGWAIMVVLVVIGALVYFMGPNIVNSMIPTKCLSGDPGITCKGSKVTATSVSLRFQNNYHEPVTIDTIRVQKNGVDVCTIAANKVIAVGGAESVGSTGCSGLTADSKEKLSIMTSFYKASEGSAFAHPVKGEVVATAANTAGSSGSNPGTSAKDILDKGGSVGDGVYWIDPDGVGIGVDPFQVYCDMTTNGGGWTIVAAYTGANGEQPLVSDTEVLTGNPLSFQNYNINRAKKMALSAVSGESLFKRDTGVWIKANHALFDSSLNTPNTHRDWGSITITSSSGTSASNCMMGYSNYYIAGGGDYGITTSGITFDHHSTSYYHLRGACSPMYLYSYSMADFDGDAGYDVNTALGTWSVTSGCDYGEGGVLKFYAAMR